ncbi:hypothetical protein D3Z50_06085 [Clostridiaceae bacterium]|nr:hypothetical protein [Clostridiaceae bacterium]
MGRAEVEAVKIDRHGLEQTIEKDSRKRAKGQNLDKKFEKCICCHKRLNIPMNMEIEFRSFYIEGAGQLCYNCYQELYVRKS